MDVDRLVPDPVHDYRRHGTDPADLYRSPAQVHTIRVPGGTPPPPPPPPPAAAPVKIVKVIQTDIVNGQLRTPTKIPQKVQMIKEEEAPPPVMASAGVVGGVPGGVPGGSMGGVMGSILSATPTVAPK